MRKSILLFKELLLAICFCATISSSMQSQTVTLYEGFDNYVGTLASVPAGWYMAWNTSSSYYSSANNYGLSSPSYKFGIDKDSIITESFAPSDSLSFWIKGEGPSFSMYDTLTILWSPDSLNWYVLFYLDNIPTVGTIYSFPINHSANHLTFIFTKYTGNLAFDDVKLTSYTHTGIIPENSNNISVESFPNPSNTMVTFQAAINGIHHLFSFNSKLIVSNVLGQEIYQQSMANDETKIDVSKLSIGTYFYEIKDGMESYKGKFMVNPK